MILRTMALRAASIFVLLFALAASCAAQKCKGMQVKYETEIQYPNSARASHLEGDVVLQLHIAADGTITADVVSGPPALAESAKRFAESWSITWQTAVPPTACAPVLRVVYKLKADTFKVKEKLPTHMVVEAPPIETNEPAQTPR